jgi:hypothetical protein
LSSPSRNTVSDVGHSDQHPLHFIKNPYQKLKKIILNDSVSSEHNVPLYSVQDVGHDMLENRDVCAEDILPWGDDIQEKLQDDTRIFFQNINGFSTKNLAKWNMSLEWLRQKSVDIAGMAEPNLNVQNPKTVHMYSNKLTQFGNRSTGTFAKNTNPSESYYQPGGAFIMCNESWKSRIVEIIHDKRQWGRYVGYTFRLKQNKTLTVLSAYRVVNRLGTSLGHKTSVRHQREQSQLSGISTSVRQLCLNDLEEFATNCTKKFGDDHLILIMIDANETIKDESENLQNF